MEGIEDDVLSVRRYTAADGAGPRNGIRLLYVVVGERADIGLGGDVTPHVVLHGSAVEGALAVHALLCPLISQ